MYSENFSPTVTLFSPLQKNMDSVLCILQNKFCIQSIALSISISLPDLGMEIRALLPCMPLCVCVCLHFAGPQRLYHNRSLRFISFPKIVYNLSVVGCSLKTTNILFAFGVNQYGLQKYEFYSENVLKYMIGNQPFQG